VGVLGSRGFIGGHVVRALRRRGYEVRTVAAPHVVSAARDSSSVLAEIERQRDAQLRLRSSLAGCRVVINAAGLAEPGAAASDSLLGANAVLPGVVCRALAEAGAARLVHVSSAAVQGCRSVLDESLETQPFSPYSLSKALGEWSVVRCAATLEAVIYRPTSVHSEDRRTTRRLSRLARSPLASVAGEGNRATPQVLVENVADGIAAAATRDEPVQGVVLQPHEGWTCEGFLLMLSQTTRPVTHVRSSLAARLVSGGYWVGRRVRPMTAVTRRIDMLWLGQEQVTGQLTEWGWRPPAGHHRWAELAEAVA